MFRVTFHEQTLCSKCLNAVERPVTLSQHNTNNKVDKINISCFAINISGRNNHQQIDHMIGYIMDIYSIVIII